MTRPKLPLMAADVDVRNEAPAPEFYVVSRRRRKLNKAQVAEQQVRCYELRVAGWTLRAIAEEVGVALSTVEKRIKDEADARVRPLRETFHQMQLDMIDRCKREVDRQIQDGRAVARNSEVMVKLLEREAKLLGLDAATQVEAVVHQVDQTDIALAELVREAQAAAAVAESRIQEEVTTDATTS